MKFLQSLWVRLDQKKKQEQGKEKTKEPKFKNAYPGFRSIAIQQLDPKSSKPTCKKDNKDGSVLWGAPKRRLLTYEQNVKLTHPTDNGFFSTFYEAYMNHGDLKITPDQIWLAIMLWFTKYVDDNAEELRTAFVMHAGKKKLTVRTHSADEREWNEFFDKVIEEIRKNTVKGVTEKLECNFSSTSRFQRLFSTAIIMNSFKKYFDYERMGGGCGIQNIHMGGTLQDWIKLKDKLAGLTQFDVEGQVKKYVRGLAPVLDQFIQTYKGNAHLQFWNNIYQQRVNPNVREYEPSTVINGWLIKFFTTRDQIHNMEDLSIEGISVDIKFINLNTGEEKDLKMIGGCKGYAVEQNKVYRPHYSFVIAQNMSAKKFRIYKPKKIAVREPLKMNKINFGELQLQKRQVTASQIHTRMASRK